ncbi:MAG: hypothetical protein KF809_12975 [Chloroflexi bacterium]|nr:hypothetical protein [Chloroflexota bacterium]
MSRGLTERYRETIARAIAGHGPEDPVELWMIHEAVDYRERDMIDAAELNASLASLAAEGRVRELPGHRYIEGRETVGSTTMTPVTTAEWAEARQAYSDWFARAYASLPREPDEGPLPVRLLVELPERGGHQDARVIDALGRALVDSAGRLGLEAIPMAGFDERAFEVWTTPEHRDRVVGLIGDLAADLGRPDITVVAKPG